MERPRATVSPSCGRTIEPGVSSVVARFSESSQVSIAEADSSSKSRRLPIGASIGAGLLGLARIDVGYQLTTIPHLLVDGEPETRRWRAHFSIGQAF